MTTRDEIARYNRKHLLAPINLVSFIIVGVIVFLFNHYGLKEYAMGYCISTAVIVSQVLLTSKKRVRINLALLLITEPMMISAIVILVMFFLR